MTTMNEALLGAPPAEVPLLEAPLVRVIAQVRFPTIASISNLSFIAGFQEALRAQYPFLFPEQIQGIVLGPHGVTQVVQQAWRLVDAEGNWRLTLADEFVALETQRYQSRMDFVARWKVILAALQQHIKPTRCDRLGVRYIDRLTEPSLQEIATLVRPELLGVSGLPFSGKLSLHQSQALFDLEGSQLNTRWGLLPPNFTIDPSAVEALAVPSWLLDLDMSSTSILSFDSENLAMVTEQYAARAYAFFRWAVTDAFLKRYAVKQEDVR